MKQEELLTQLKELNIDSDTALKIADQYFNLQYLDRAISLLVVLSILIVVWDMYRRSVK